MTDERPVIPEELLERYRATILGRKGLPPKKANRLFDENRGYFRVLRATPEGRRAIERFLEDDEVEVRLTAASQTLAWDPKRAEEVLEAIATGDGMAAFEAEMVLKEFRVGRLNPDW
jgi:stalled ribosome rescue protein Dom34